MVDATLPLARHVRSNLYSTELSKSLNLQSRPV